MHALHMYLNVQLVNTARMLNTPSTRSCRYQSKHGLPVSKVLSVIFIVIGGPCTVHSPWISLHVRSTSFRCSCRSTIRRWASTTHVPSWRGSWTTIIHLSPTGTTIQPTAATTIMTTGPRPSPPSQVSSGLFLSL